MNAEKVVKCELCGHIMQVNDLDNLICDDCGYDKFETLLDNNDTDFIIDDTELKPKPEPKDCILYLVTQYGDTMVITKKSRFAYHGINSITSDMRLYTYNGALSARDALLKRHPDWHIKVKQFK